MTSLMLWLKIFLDAFSSSCARLGGPPGGHLDPTRLEGELFIFEIALAPRLGKAQYDEVYDLIAAAIMGAVSSWPEAKELLRGKTFVRYLH